MLGRYSHVRRPQGRSTSGQDRKPRPIWHPSTEGSGERKTGRREREPLTDSFGNRVLPLKRKATERLPFRPSPSEL